MRSEEIREMCIKSADDMLAYSQLFGASESVIRVRRYTLSGRGYLVLVLDSPVSDTSGICLRVGEDIFGYGCLEFPFCEPRSRTLGVKFNQGDTEAIFKDHPNVEVVVDLSFLIAQAREYFELYGDAIRYPPVRPSFDQSEYSFPEGRIPTERQKEAVRTILNSSLSYVWGAPGTGKTQMVLATSIVACVSRGLRVAVIAPTNNAVEQVLRGLVSAIESDSTYSSLIDTGKDIARIGSPTPSFLRDFPGMCEPKATRNALAKAENERRVLEGILEERIIDRIRPHLALCIEYLGEGRDSEARSEASMAVEIICGCTRFDDLAIALRTLDYEAVSNAYRTLYSRIRILKDVSFYADYTDEDIRVMIDGTTEVPEGSADPKECRIVACTPQTYITRFRPNGSKGDKPEFDVDHIFVDEAGYCNCMMCLPLLANGVPMTLLGDHKQLPPVCTVDTEILRKYISKGGFMRYGFLWSQSALFTESVLSSTAVGISEAFMDLSDPSFNRTQRADLTESHRFGHNLGSILDRFVYRNGVRGMGRHPLEIICIDVECPPRDKRINRPEAEAVRAYLELAEPGEFCILTPYHTQIDVLRDVLPEHEEKVLTVHRSQGREWDTVILSVQDGKGCDREVPLRFTSSLSETGLKVINTAVSRAKRRLVVVCDRSFWSAQKGELIAGLVSDSSCSSVLRFDGGKLVDAKSVYTAV